MCGQERAHVERLQGVIGAEHVMHDQHLLLVQGADPHRLACARRQRVGPVQGAGPQLVAVEIAGPHVEQGGA